MVSKTVAALALASSVSAKLPSIQMKGAKFFYENGTQFFMKGIAYQQDILAGGDAAKGSTEYIDPLADPALCKRDVPLLKELGSNTIRTYAIDPTADHSACMKLLDDAGIYVISDLSQPMMSINRDDPKWNVDLYKRYTDVVDELSQYSNVIGFFAGNEVSDSNNNTAASAYVKAALRDTKAHIKNSVDRWMGVGYATNDHPDIRDEIAEYFNCGEESEATDFWGYNIYSWCGDSTIQKSGYDKQVEFFKHYPVPSFFAEYGCNSDGAENRLFTETAALFSDAMTSVFSGGLVYMYFQEANDYGVVEVKNGKATPQKDFYKLAAQHKKADPKGVDMDEYTPTGKRDTCPKLTDMWQANSVLPPTPDASLCDCMVAESTCGLASTTKPKDFGEIFGFICGEKPDLCVGINGNATTGIYGAYSMCNDRQKLVHILGAYHDDQKSDDACDFKGLAQVKQSTAASSCSQKLSDATEHNEKAATAVSAADASSTADADSDNAGMTVGVSHFSVGAFAVGAYVVAAMGAGAAVLL